MVGRRSSRRNASPPVELPSDVEDALDAAENVEGASGNEDDQEEDEEEESDDEPVEPNLATRVKRVNAGNRMRALLEDEQGNGNEAEEMFKEEVDDVEFKQKEEADVFDSDFGSTDEDEYGEDDEDAGERRLENEAKAEKKAAKAKKKKGFVAPSHPFARTTKDQAKKAARAAREPVASTSAQTLDDDGLPAAKRKKTSMDPAFVAPMRESSRRSAVEFKKGVKDRLVESEKRRAVATKPKRKTVKTLSQADLIAEALETEEINRAALLAFYAAEEDRREAERIAGMRYEIIGPKLTFLSRTEGSVEKKDKGKGKEELGRRRMIEVLGESGQKGWKSGTGTGPAKNTDGNSEAPPTTTPVDRTSDSQPGPVASKTGPTDASRQRDPNGPMPWTRNWLVFDQFEGSRADEYEALFGEHVDWNQPVPPRGDLKLNRCALTGLPARYRDPRTLTPYATLEAYQVLNSIVDSQAFIWTDSLGAYTGTSGFGLAREVETMWSRRPTGRVRYAASTDAPPVLIPMAAPPISMTSRPLSTRSSLGGIDRNQARSTVSREDNPYVREYAGSGGSRRGRGNDSIDGQQLPLPPLPPPSGFPPIPGSVPATSHDAFPPLPPANDPVPRQNGSPQVAPQARSININGGGGFFGSPSPFGPPGPGTSPVQARPFSPQTGTPVANSFAHSTGPSLPPLPPSGFPPSR
ncbi:hypothetical protein JCM16303_006024 [Sporobolomyces ruberrimus]